MDFQVTSALESDINRLIDIQFSAFENDPTHLILFPGPQHSKAVRADASERALKSWRQTPEMQVMKCVEHGTDVITGFARWIFYETTREEDEWKTKPTAPWAKGKHRILVEQLLATAADIRARRWGGKPYALLSLLCVHPDYQHQGVGQALMRWGLQQSANLGLVVHLESSSQGLALYRRLQFETVDTVIIDARDWDGGFERKYTVMLRKSENPPPELVQS